MEKQSEIERVVEMLKQPEVQAALGQIMLDALTQHFNSYELQIETTRADGVVVEKTIKGDPLAILCAWAKDVEGAVRGSQADTNKSVEGSRRVLDVQQQIMANMAALVSIMQQIGQGVNKIAQAASVPNAKVVNTKPIEGRIDHGAE